MTSETLRLAKFCKCLGLDSTDTLIFRHTLAKAGALCLYINENTEITKAWLDEQLGEHWLSDMEGPFDYYYWVLNWADATAVKLRFNNTKVIENHED